MKAEREQTNLLLVLLVTAETVLRTPTARRKRQVVNQSQYQSIRPISTQIINSVEKCHVGPAYFRIGNSCKEAHHRNEHSIESNLAVIKKNTWCLRAIYEW